jgi:hypothetical protein
MTADEPPAMSGRADASSEDLGEELDGSAEIYFDPDALGEAPPVEPPTEVGPYDEREDREMVRGRLAIGLISLLALLTFSALGGVLAGADAQSIRSILEVIVPPVVALCGSALGFYYASAAGNGGRQNE